MCRPGQRLQHRLALARLSPCQTSRTGQKLCPGCPLHQLAPIQFIRDDAVRNDPQRIKFRQDATADRQGGGFEGPPVVVLANSLGTDLRRWEALLPLLPQGLRYLRYDKQGHGLSQIGRADRIEDHAADAIALIEQVAGGPVVIIGLWIGRLIAQRVASQRPDVVRALVLN